VSVFVEDRRGADPNLEVCIGAAPHNVPRHVCRGSIPPAGTFVHVCATMVNRQMQPRACISARAASCRC
jgi:hypothetical protein